MAQTPIYVRHAPVIQGSFAGSRPRIAVRHHQAGAVQLSQQGQAMQVPPTLLSFRPGGVGQRLPESVQKKMESLFGADFSDVRVHVGPEASSIGALAFTYGSDLYFAHGQYEPHSPHGHRLLGHELTHVLQQRAGRVRNPFGSGVAVVQDPGLEAEAERMGVRAGMAPNSRSPRGAAVNGVQKHGRPHTVHVTQPKAQGALQGGQPKATPRSSESTSPSGFQASTIQRNGVRSLKELAVRAVIANGGIPPGVQLPPEIVDFIQDVELATPGDIEALWNFVDNWRREIFEGNRNATPEEEEALNGILRLILRLEQIHDGLTLPWY